MPGAMQLGLGDLCARTMTSVLTRMQFRAFDLAVGATQKQHDELQVHVLSGSKSHVFLVSALVYTSCITYHFHDMNECGHRHLLS